jgi:hypothetical protein
MEHIPIFYLALAIVLVGILLIYIFGKEVKKELQPDELDIPDFDLVLVKFLDKILSEIRTFKINNKIDPIGVMVHIKWKQPIVEYFDAMLIPNDEYRIAGLKVYYNAKINEDQVIIVKPAMNWEDKKGVTKPKS